MIPAAIRAAAARLRVLRDAGDDDGSVLLLTLGYAMLALAVILVCVDATSLYLAQKDLDAVADAAALAGADGFHLRVDAAGPHAELTTPGVRQAASAVLEAGGGVRLVSAESPDGAASRVTVASTWHPPVLTVFVPQGWELGATATSRTAFR
jgi:uncharacterized membrane protein